MQDHDKFQEILRQKGVKGTKNRKEILSVLKEAKHPLTAEETFLNLKERNVVMNLSTVYRSLETLTCHDLVLKSSLIDDGKARYEYKHSQHMHHLVCMGCHQSTLIPGCPLKDFEKSLKDELDFDVTEHRLELYGYCHDCRVKNS